MDNAPKAVTKAEWNEILRLASVKESYGLETKRDGEAFAQGAYAVKFNYMSDGPGYAGDLFVLLGGEPECPPLVILRQKGKLREVDSSNY